MNHWTLISGTLDSPTHLTPQLTRLLDFVKTARDRAGATLALSIPPARSAPAPATRMLRRDP